MASSRREPIWREFWRVRKISPHSRSRVPTPRRRAFPGSSQAGDRRVTGATCGAAGDDGREALDSLADRERVLSGDGQDGDASSEAAREGASEVMPTLRELRAVLLRYRQETPEEMVARGVATPAFFFDHVLELREAHGIRFICPKSFATHGGEAGWGAL